MSHPVGIPDRRTPTIEAWHGGGSDGAYIWGHIERQVMEWAERPELILCSSAGLFNALAYTVGVYRARNLPTPEEKAQVIIQTMRHAWEYVIARGAPFAAGKDFVPDMALTMLAKAATAGHMGMANTTADMLRLARMHPLVAAMVPEDYRPFATVEAVGHPLYDFVTAAIGPADEIRAAMAHPDAPCIITGAYDIVARRHEVVNSKEQVARGELNLSQFLASMALPAMVMPVHGRLVDDAYSGVNGNHWRALLALQKREPRYAAMRINEIDLGAADIIEQGVELVNPYYHADKAANDALLPLVQRTHPYRFTTLAKGGRRSSAKGKLFPDAKAITELHSLGRADRGAALAYQPATGGPVADAPTAPQRRAGWRTPVMQMWAYGLGTGNGATAGA